MLSFARMFLKELTELMSADRSPIVDRRPELILDPSIQKRLTHFSLVSLKLKPYLSDPTLQNINQLISEFLDYTWIWWNCNSSRFGSIKWLYWRIS
uniref:Uncharacterized protein n=1 Tax=Meloidogyne incognita TaxID=6306 RepID=A0A914LIQ8_MELIC